MHSYLLRHVAVVMILGIRLSFTSCNLQRYKLPYETRSNRTTYNITEARFNKTRADAVHSDSLLTELLRQNFGQAKK